MKTAVSLGGYLLMVLGMVALIQQHSLFAPAFPVVLTQLVAVGLGVWARVTFGRRSFHLAANPTEGGLVTWGPYRYIRHPIYTSVCLFAGAGIAAHLSWLTVLLGLVILAGVLLRIFCEESSIPARYPEYRDYAAKTWRMLPFVF